MADFRWARLTLLLRLFQGKVYQQRRFLQRARARGIDADAVLKELTKPRYDPAQFRTPQPGTAGLAPRFSDGSVAEPNANRHASPEHNAVSGDKSDGWGDRQRCLLYPRPACLLCCWDGIIPTAGPAEGTFPDMVRMPQMGTVEMANPLAVNDAEAAHFQQGPFAAPSPPRDGNAGDACRCRVATHGNGPQHQWIYVVQM